jgi:hypothetical protein
MSRDAHVGTAALGCPFERSSKDFLLPALTLLAKARPGTFSASISYLKPEEVMRAYLTNLTPKARMLLAVPIVAIAYPVIMILLPAIVRAIVPDVVRSVLSLI